MTSSGELVLRVAFLTTEILRTPRNTEVSIRSSKLGFSMALGELGASVVNA